MFAVLFNLLINVTFDLTVVAHLDGNTWDTINFFSEPDCEKGNIGCDLKEVVPPILSMILQILQKFRNRKWNLCLILQYQLFLKQHCGIGNYEEIHQEHTQEIHCYRSKRVHLLLSIPHMFGYLPKTLPHHLLHCQSTLHMTISTKHRILCNFPRNQNQDCTCRLCVWDIDEIIDYNIMRCDLVYT